MYGPSSPHRRNRAGLWFAAFTIASLLMLLASSTEPAQTLQRVTTRALDPVRQTLTGIGSGVAGLFGTIGEIDRLRSENAELRVALAGAQQRIAELTEAARENEELRQLAEGERQAEREQGLRPPRPAHLGVHVEHEPGDEDEGEGADRAGVERQRPRARLACETGGAGQVRAHRMLEALRRAPSGSKPTWRRRGDQRRGRSRRSPLRLWRWSPRLRRARAHLRDVGFGHRAQRGDLLDDVPIAVAGSEVRRVRSAGSSRSVCSTMLSDSTKLRQSVVPISAGCRCCCAPRPGRPPAGALPNCRLLDRQAVFQETLLDPLQGRRPWPSPGTGGGERIRRRRRW